MDKKIDVCGILFDNVNMAQAINIIEKRILECKDDTASLLCVANQDIIHRMRKTSGLSKELINSSFLIIPDGYSIIYAAKFLGKK